MGEIYLEVEGGEFLVEVLVGFGWGGGLADTIYVTVMITTVINQLQLVLEYLNLG